MKKALKVLVAAWTGLTIAYAICILFVSRLIQAVLFSFVPRSEWGNFSSGPMLLVTLVSYVILPLLVATVLARLTYKALTGEHRTTSPAMPADVG
jgi:intracellular septation protein A